MAPPSEGSSPGPARARGLPSIQRAREDRSAGRTRWPAAKYWGYGGVLLVLCLIFQWKSSQGELETNRQKLMASQRAMAVELGPRWLPLRDKVERWTTELSQAAGPEVVDLDNKWDFREKSGIYLRLRVEEAGNADAIRAGAKDSLRDGFTSCLMRLPNPDPLGGPACKRTRECGQNQFCNERDHCTPAAQPFNLRVAYRTMHVLTDAWIHDVQDVSSELGLRMLTASFDDTLHDDVPLAMNLLQRAQYFLLVLDEPVPGAAPVPSSADGGTSAREAVQAVPHFARIGVWRLADDKLLLRVRREANGQLLGSLPQADAEVIDARQRQANNCALALSVRQAMGDTGAAALPAP